MGLYKLLRPHFLFNKGRYFFLDQIVRGDGSWSIRGFG